MFQKGKVYTAGVFDLFHAGHMESIMKILDCFPDQELLIGVATDRYTKSFKRTPFQTMSERLHTIRSVFATNKRVTVIEDPLETVECSYEQAFYERYGITDHCQGTDFDENSSCYQYIKSVNGFHIMGRSQLMSTTELINKLSPSRVVKMDGDTNENYRLGNIVIKRIVYGDVDFIDYAYGQLLEKGLFGITSYQRFGKLVFLPFIEGNVTPSLSFDQVLELTKQINLSGLKPKNTLMDMFAQYGFMPDLKVYGELLSDLTYVCHGDLAYPNLVKNQKGLFPIDWEFMLLGTEYWDLATYIASVYVYQYVDCRSVLDAVNDMENSLVLKKTLMLLCDYWVQWSIFTGHDFFSKESKMLRSFLYSNL